MFSDLAARSIHPMRDSDQIRRRIEDRLNELGLEAVQVSQELGFNRGYLHDYFRKGTPKVMPAETKVKLAQRLRISPADLGVSGFTPTVRPSGFFDDVKPYTVDRADFPPHIVLFEIQSRALDNHPHSIIPGRLAAININKTDPAQIPVGAIVIAQLCDRSDLTKSHGTVMRQFLPPDKLATNSSTGNAIMALDDSSLPFVAVIKGTLAYMVDAVNHDGDAFAPPS